jgi:putative lipoprotein
MENLVQSLGKLMTPDVLNQLSSMTGTNSTTTAKAMSAIGPTLVGALSRYGSSESGAQSVMNLLNSSGVDDSSLSNVAGLLGDSASLDKITSSGGSLLNTLLGSNTATVTNAISSLTGMSGGSIDQLLKIGAPLLMGVVGKAVKGGNLNAAGLADLLGGQKVFVNQAMPNGLDLNQLLGKAPAVEKTASKSSGSSGKSARKIPWLWIALGALALALIGYLIFTSLNGGGAADAATVSGTVTKLDRSALPEDAVLTVRIQDTSRADAPATTVGEQIIELDGGQLPVAYSVAYDSDEILDQNTYTMSARIENAAGELLYINDTSIPVITSDNPTVDVEIPVVAAN